MAEVVDHLGDAAFVIESHDRERPLALRLIDRRTVDEERSRPGHRRLAIAEVRGAEHPDFVDLAGIDSRQHVLRGEHLLIVERIRLPPALVGLHALEVSVFGVCPAIDLRGVFVDVAPFDDGEFHAAVAAILDVFLVLYRESSRILPAADFMKPFVFTGFDDRIVIEDEHFDRDRRAV